MFIYFELSQKGLYNKNSFYIKALIFFFFKTQILLFDNKIQSEHFSRRKLKISLEFLKFYYKKNSLKYSLTNVKQ